MRQWWGFGRISCRMAPDNAGLQITETEEGSE